MKTVILLTGCINPNGMPFTQLTDANERQKQYVDAILFYLSNTNCPIVFCENSNTDISHIFNNAQNRLEILTFPGNQHKQRGKGYGEVEIIEYALQHSLYLKEDCIIIKITGRLIVNNIGIIINSLPSHKNFITCLFHSDLSFADSRIFCATSPFFREFITNKKYINDSKNIFFEHILASTVLSSSMCFVPYVENPLIMGISGSTGEKYSHTATDRKKKYLFKLYSWHQTKKVYDTSPHKHQSILNNISLYFNIFKFTLLSKLTK